MSSGLEGSNSNRNAVNTSSSLEDKTFTFIKHSNLNQLNLSFKLLNLEGILPFSATFTTPSSSASSSSNSSLYVEINLWSNNNSILTNKLNIKSSYKSFNTTSTANQNSSNSYNFNELITLPFKIKDLSLNSTLVFTFFSHSPCSPSTSTSTSSSAFSSNTNIKIIGGTTLKLFGKKSTLKKGQQRLLVHPSLPGDGSLFSETPSKPVPYSHSNNDEVGGETDERNRLENLVKKRENGDLIRMDWLDKLSFRQIEKIHAAESATSTKLYFYIDLPRFDFPVVYSEITYPPPVLSSLNNPSATSSVPFNQYSTTSLHPIPSTSTTPSVPTLILGGQNESNNTLFQIIDPEITQDNPIESKHRRLIRSHRNNPLDRELKPNSKIRDELNSLLKFPPTQSLTSQQKDLIWQFRFYLTKDKKGLNKFLKSVTWSDELEVSLAVGNLLPIWCEIEMEDALELLGPGEGFRDRRVRGYAVGLLAKADDDELMLYLLQLVQALKFETPPTPISHQSPSTSTSLRTSKHSSSSKLSLDPNTSNANDGIKTLEEFLIDRSAKNPVLGNHFRWYINVEMEDKNFGKLYEGVKKRFDRKIAELQVEGEPDRLELLRRQSKFIARISQLALEIRNSKDPRPKKIEKLRSALQDPKSPLTSFPPFPLPLDAKKLVIGIDGEKSSVFKSNLFPLRLHLLCSDGTNYPIIFKNGDDLRQDQLVIQLFTLMDKLLRQENLDLKLMPYRVLATSTLDGMVQFVESKTLQDISNDYAGNGGLLGYLKEGNEDPGSVGTYGIKPEVLDTYIRSCAGYCVVTYLMGVGDRHLDNLLLSPDGHFFHVDFGYILGRDPKPFPPSIKVCKEMVDAMGGLNSPHYIRFKNLCYTGFITLRKNANLIINLVSLMVDANIPDIRFEPDKAVMKVQDKFLLNLSEEEAIKAFESLLNENSYFASVLDRIHSVAQYWRS